VHHIQHRSFTHIIPYLNFPPNIPERPDLSSNHHHHDDRRNAFVPKEYILPSPSPSHVKVPTRNEVNGPGRHKYKEPVGRERAIFVATADVQSDIYYLVHPSAWYMTDVAYIPNYKTSVMMNGLFRRIKENQNLDAMEDSDDEDDFYDIRYDKYVNLTKKLTMECMYHKKFHRWIPLRVIQ
jgi:hypothetical protein